MQAVLVGLDQAKNETAGSKHDHKKFTNCGWIADQFHHTPKPFLAAVLVGFEQ